jgi:tetratricopeptide (TPR) repeat protein
MSHPTRWLAACTLLVAALPCPAAPTPEQVAEWVKQLGDDDFATREKASKLLWEAGKAAEPALRKAAESGDAETARRANEILEKFKFGIYPDTPPKLVALINQFRAGDLAAKQDALKGLMAMGARGYSTLVKLVNTESDADLRRELQAQVVREAPRVAGPLLADGETALVEELLDSGVAGNAPSAHEGYAAYWLLRGQIDKKIAAWSARPAPLGLNEQQASKVLAYLHRAAGDLPRARARAEQSGDVPLLLTVLTEVGDWKELARVGAGGDGLSEVEALGYRAAYARLSGDKDGFAKAVEDLVKSAEGKPADASEWWFAAEALLINEQPDKAVEVLRKCENMANAVEVLFAQGKFREGLKLAEEGGGRHPFWRELRTARTLHRLGERDAARKRFAALADQIKHAKETGEHFGLVDAEYKLGLKEEAFAHAAAILARPPGEGHGWVFGRLFPDRDSEADVWWRVLRNRFAAEETTATMKRLRALMNGKLASKELADLARGAADVSGLEAEKRQPWLMGLAAACLRAGLDDPGLGLLDKAAAAGPSPEPLTRLGDHFAGKKQWDEAARRYQQAWEKEPKDPLPLFLRGRALAAAGKEAEGKKLTESAHLLPLGDHEVRGNFADALAKRGYADDARREYELIVRTGDRDGWLVGHALSRLARHADAAGAADAYQRMLLRLLRTNTGFAETEAYVAVPQRIHAARAQGLLAAGKAAEAVKEADAALALRPFAPEVAIALVPELQKRGHKKEAEAVFGRVWSAYEGLLKDYPNSAWAHNALAWLAARCRRNLDAALRHSQKAVQLEPDNAAYLDTLAEVHFQKGDKDRAVALMKQCLEREPAFEFYRRQLRRYEAGDPAADFPEP